MAVVSPAFAIVRPRVRLKHTGDVHLIEDIVAEMAETIPNGIIRITGGPGSGKSTALGHLAALFAHDEHICFLDAPELSELEERRSESLVVAATSQNVSSCIELVLQPWGMDELIEYLLAVHRDDCGSVISRLGAAAKRSWCPQLACIVMDEFASDYELDDASDALVLHMHELLSGPKQRRAATYFSLTVLTGGKDNIVKAKEKLANARCSAQVTSLLRHKLVQLPLAASRIISLLHKEHIADLEKSLPSELIELVGWQCAANSVALSHVRKLLALQRAESAHAMAASVLLIADPSWRPERPRKPWQLSTGFFRGAQWNDVNFFRAGLEKCDFSDANLQAANFESANLMHANFAGATLRGAKMFRANASRACFQSADLRDAKLPNATLISSDLSHAVLANAALMMADLNGAVLSQANFRKADLSQTSLVGAIVNETDFTEANLTGANLLKLELRTACLNGICLEKANLREAQFEDVQLLHARLREADLRFAHLTGSAFPASDLRDADLRGAHLAEIDWEEADLQNANLVGASFHMGSSRSGLVNSPYACEGSKTGFYTDDLEDLSFKRPEEVRKANLRGADLRGVQADGVDFYLVDLRDAKLDPELRKQARDTGAILSDRIA